MRKMPTELASWEYSRSFDNISSLIGKNRKLLLEAFTRSGESMSVDFETAKRVVQMIQRGVQLDDEQYGILFKGCMVADRVDY